MIGIENLDHFILVIKNLHNNVCIGFDGVVKPKNINDFLMC
jgi:hypothetical protein